MTINATFFISNRAKLTSELAVGVIVVGAYQAMQLTGDEAQPFRQEANFWYLTGIDRPDWQLIIDESGKSWLVMPKMSETTRIFIGGLSAESAQKISGVDAVISSSEATDLLKRLAKKHDTVYTLGPDPSAKYCDFVQNPAPARLRAKLKRLFKEIKDVRVPLANQRAIKQPVELEAMQRAIDLTMSAFDAIKQKLPQLKYEYEAEAEFTYYFRRYGARHAFDPIVASGKNACTLHYSVNDERLQANSLVVMDIGAKVGNYPADITRTYAFGELTKRQRALHDAVYQAQQQVINLLRPGLAIRTYLERVDDIMKQAELSLGLINSAEDQTGYRKYFPHAISHGLGVDVHESLGKTDELKPGMVLTVEPGIYISEEGLGVRIEDDILITETGHSNLSAGLQATL